MAKKKKKYDNASEGFTPDPEPSDEDLLTDSSVNDILDTLFLNEDGEISWGKMLTYAIIGVVIAICLNWNVNKEGSSISSLETTYTTTL